MAEPATETRAAQSARGRLQDRVAIVTGGALGIGRGIVELFAREGASVAIFDVDAANGSAAAELVGGRFFHCDVSNEAAIIESVGAVHELLGVPTVVVNNAAIFLQKGAEQASPDDWHAVCAVNLIGPALLVKHTVPLMRRAGGGSIVNIGSVSSFIAQKDMLTYNATKAAVAEMTRCMALDYVEDGIRVNGVCPGAVCSSATERVLAERGLTIETAPTQPNFGLEHMMRRLATPTEIAYAVLFLACDEASFVTGENLMVDGGWTAH